MICVTGIDSIIQKADVAMIKFKAMKMAPPLSTAMARYKRWCGVQGMRSAADDLATKAAPTKKLPILESCY